VRYLVAYTANDRGRDALRLGVALARSFNAELDIVVVLRRDDAFAPPYPPVGHTEEILAAQAQRWLDEALTLVPSDVVARTHIRFAASAAQGIEAAAEEFDAGLIVLGGSSAGLLRRHSIGANANTLLHSSSRPIALAPRGYEPETIEHIDVAVGTRPGAPHVLAEAVQASVRSGLPLRLVTLVDTGGHDTAEAGEVAASTEAQVRDLLDRTVAETGTPSAVDVHVAGGPDVPTAVAETDWHDNAVLILGSSRLAERHRLFLGSTAGRMLRALSVPVVIVPRRDDSSEGHRA